ncbi:hypothetical protein PC114_g20269 [Phytophthora cactorum]|uniref:Uncharacterized protein n=2 Tax=Phytophthora cactorum TaxID=29920 RepID=A0A8T1B4E9_9STRA|nr:hypothetical protein PC114_g20269 [Phytophthora cactorum]KAG2894682.1 hypothetical protein PC115_g18087 [Phytophthora cactorum]KAG3017347.1 hypothetical protein PC120_g11057 [Phytophthora cactorum]
MISTTSILFVMASFVASLSQVGAHGYMYMPLAEFTDSVTSAWIVQIEPQCDTDLYGANCGFTDPDAAAKDPPTTGDATFSRGMVHAGPCEIWLDDTMVLSNDDCQTAYGDGTQEKASVFTPVDHSSCSTSGCMLRFYWLAFQGVDSKTVWQVYKDCVPLTGPAEGSTSTSTSTNSTSSISSSTTEEASTSIRSGTSDTSLTAESPQITTATPTSNEASTETTTDAPASTPSPSEKCTARKRQ